jgi:hypothetical protein
VRDPLSHEDITASSFRGAAASVAMSIGEHLDALNVAEDQPLLVLAALVPVFLTAAEDLGVDPVAAFEQLADAFDAGDMRPDPADEADLLKTYIR